MIASHQENFVAPLAENNIEVREHVPAEHAEVRGGNGGERENHSDGGQARLGASWIAGGPDRRGGRPHEKHRSLPRSVFRDEGWRDLQETLVKRGRLGGERVLRSLLIVGASHRC